MEHVLNIQAIRKKMKQKPVGQRLHHFFNGATDLLTVDEIRELKKISAAENRKVTRFIDRAIADKKKQKAA